MPADRPAAPAADTRPPARILLSEDEDGVRDFVRAALELGGYAVVPAADAAQALARFRTSPAAFDLVLTDVVMPGRTGPELAADLRAVRPDVRVLFMSAFVGSAHALPAGAELLEKPFGIDELLAAVARHLAG